MKTRPPHGKRRAIWPSFSLFPWRSLFPSSSSPSPSPSPPPQITIIAAIGGPTARRGPYVLRCRHRRRRRLQHAAGIMKVATSPACPPRPLTPLYPARPPSLPMHCSAFELEAKAKGPPACVRDDNALEARRHRRRTETERKKERRQSLREEEERE